MLIGRLKGKRDPGLLSSSSFPERFSLLESMLLPAFNTVEKIFSVSDEHFDTHTHTHTQRLFPPFFLNFRFFPIFLLLRSRVHGDVGMKIVKMKWRGEGELTLIITLRERRIEEFRIRFGNKVACWSNFRCSLSRGEFTTVAMRRKLLQPQCSSGCKEKSFVAGCTSVLLHFFLSPPPIISILTQSSIVTDKLPYLRGSGRFLHESLIEEFQKRIKDIYIYIYFITILVQFFRFLYKNKVD